MSIGSSEEAKPLVKDVCGGVDISTVSGTAVWASPLTYLKILGSGPLLTAGGTDLAGWEETVYDDQLPAIPFSLVDKLPAKLAP